MIQEPIIAKVDKALLKKELNDERFVRRTNKAGNEIYIVNHHNSPNVMKEIGRLRELTFRSAGGGTGLEIDIDEMDTSENCYQQMIVYSPEDEELVGGYRFIKGGDALNKHTDKYELSTLHYFDFSEKFVQQYLHYTVELGRSWVQPAFQPSVNPRKGLFALDNLWDGLGAIIMDNPDIQYLFGKVTMYPDYNREGRDALLYFIKYFFPDKEILVSAKNPLSLEHNESQFRDIYEGKSYIDAHKSLIKYLKERGEGIPPLINSYMSLSSTMKTFGTALNSDFGSVEETGILVKISDIYPKKKIRHTDTYSRDRIK